MGLPREQILERSIQGILPAESAEIVCRYDREALDSGQQIVAAEFEVKTPSNGVRFVNTTRLVVHNSAGQAEHLISVLEDITARREAEEKVRHMAKHDALTDLPNRLLLRERLENGLLGLERGHRSLAILMIDLDRFKEVNDSLGHHAGDELLKAVAGRLRSCVRESATVARLGGDEFAIVESVGDVVTEASALAERILHALSAPLDLGDHQVTSAGSIGIAVAPMDGSDPDQLLKKADLALYRAKSERRGTFKFYEAEMDRSVQARRTVERELRDALANAEFVLHYQPFVRLQGGEVSGCEALLRWCHPERGLILPNEFVALAEETGLIGPIGEWVLRTACAQAATWPGNLRIAVNLSPAQFKGEQLVSTVVSTLATSGLAPHRLELEVTEALLMQDREAAIATLGQLHTLGVRVALDDFGTGFTSLSFLRQFPFDNIKIDRSFVTELSDPKGGSGATARAVIRLANSLGKTTTAKGIERRELCDLVRAEGCTEMQGYYFSKPVPSSDIGKLWQREPVPTTNAA